MMKKAREERIAAREERALNKKEMKVEQVKI